MTKVRIRGMIAKTKWQLVTFHGSSGGESVGIVDMVALRRNHAACKPPAKRGDSFEIVRIQVKGGGARFPTTDEVHRLRLVGRAYKAKAILLAQWKRGAQAEFFSLRKRPSPKARDNWIKLIAPAAIFH